VRATPLHARPAAAAACDARATMRCSSSGVLLAARARAAAGAGAGAAARRRRAVAMPSAAHAAQQPPLAASASSPSSAWHDLLSLRSAVLRDAGAVLACPPLLCASRELPTCDTLPPDERASSSGGGGGSAACTSAAASEARWRHQLAWLRALDAAPSPALARLADAKTQARLGLYFQARRSLRKRVYATRFFCNC
jgi:hypothetical protein